MYYPTPGPVVENEPDEEDVEENHDVEDAVDEDENWGDEWLGW